MQEYYSLPLSEPGETKVMAEKIVELVNSLTSANTQPRTGPSGYSRTVKIQYLKCSGFCRACLIPVEIINKLPPLTNKKRLYDIYPCKFFIVPSRI